MKVKDIILIINHKDGTKDLYMNGVKLLERGTDEDINNLNLIKE